MPDATFLHVQGSGDAAIRVLVLPPGPVRVGRGPLCEVRLDGPGLGDVQCMLRRRGDGWDYQPVGPPGQVWIDGQPADARRPLVFGIPFRVGDHWLTLRTPENATNDWGSFETPIPIGPREPEAGDVPKPAPPAEQVERPQSAPTVADPDDRARRWQSRLEARERWLKDRQEERQWEARWKAAGETIRARAAQPAATPRTPPTPPASTPRTAPPTTPPRPAEARSVDARPAQPVRRVADPERRPFPARVPIGPRPPVAAGTPAARIFPPAAPARPRIALPAPPPIEPTPAPAPTVDEARIEPPAEAEVEAIAAVEPEAFVEVPAVEVMVEEPTPAGPAIVEDDAASILEADWEELPRFVTDTVDSSPPMVRVEPTTWTEAPPEPPARPIESRVAEPTPARVAAEPVAEPAPRDVSAAVARPASDWPSARSIFAAQGMRTDPLLDPAATPGPSPSPRRRPRATPEPTDARAPGHWTIPLWLGWLPTAALVVGLGLAGSALAAFWVADSTAAGTAIRLALRDEKAPGPAIDLASIPRGGWWRTTAPHLAAWAVAVARSGDGEDHSAEVRSLIEDAEDASRLGAQSRFVVDIPARPEDAATVGLAELGRTRDVVRLVAIGRRLRRAGKVDSALRAYRSAFAIASAAEASDLDPPAFEDDPHVRRYDLAHEAILGGIARDMAAAGSWTPDQWAEALPGFAPAHLAAARVLGDKDRPASDRLLDLAIGLADAPPAAGLDGPEHRAAVAEALALRGRWTDAAGQYRLAIDAAGDDPTRRMWQLNLAEVADRLGDDPARARALEAAHAGDAVDAIARRAKAYRKNQVGLGAQVRRP